MRTVTSSAPCRARWPSPLAHEQADMSQVYCRVRWDCATQHASSFGMLLNAYSIGEDWQHRKMLIWKRSLFFASFAGPPCVAVGREVIRGWVPWKGASEGMIGVASDNIFRRAIVRYHAPARRKTRIWRSSGLLAVVTDRTYDLPPSSPQGRISHASPPVGFVSTHKCTNTRSLLRDCTLER